MARTSSAERRRFWQELFAKRATLGLSVAQVCEEAGVSQAVGSRRSPTKTASPLVPVRIIPDRTAADRASTMIVELPGAVRVQIPSGCDAATIQAVLEAASSLGHRGPSPC